LPYANGQVDKLDGVLKEFVRALQNAFPKLEKVDDNTLIKILEKLTELIKLLEKMNFDPKYSDHLKAHLDAVLLLFKEKDHISNLQNYIAAETERMNRLLKGDTPFKPSLKRQLPSGAGSQSVPNKKPKIFDADAHK